MKDDSLDFYSFTDALKLTKKRVIEPTSTNPMLGGNIYPTVVETTIWTDEEIEKIKKEILTKLKLN